MYLGIVFDVPPEKWPRLVELIACRYREQQVMNLDSELTKVTEAICVKLRVRGVELDKKPDGSEKALTTVDLDTLDHPESPRQVGGERVGLKVLQELGFKDLLKQAGVCERDARIALTVVIARLLHPSSERATHAWLHEKSGLLELMGPDPDNCVSLSNLYRIHNLLYAHRTTRMRGLFRRESRLLIISCYW